ncbi:MAG TPA: hypothetical protein VGQ00_00695 [Candidatus Norongarragalinales archaeon]|jgi:hypothetical protein|nr:hypothetical protein [Candidatus Norongarragalinales archaeon]
MSEALHKLFDENAHKSKFPAGHGLSEEQIKLGHALIAEHAVKIWEDEVPLFEEVARVKRKVAQLREAMEQERPKHTRGTALDKVLNDYSAIHAVLERLQQRETVRA